MTLRASHRFGGLCDFNTVVRAIQFGGSASVIGDSDALLRMKVATDEANPSNTALEFEDVSAWCPPGCSDCVLPLTGHYRFPPNTCVETDDGQCAGCPLVGAPCLQCPSTEMDSQCDDTRACNATALDGCAAGYAGVLC